MAWFVRSDYVGGLPLAGAYRVGTCPHWRPVPTGRPDHGVCALQNTLNVGRPVACAFNTLGRMPHRCPVRRLGYTIRVTTRDWHGNLPGPDPDTLEAERAAARAELAAAVDAPKPPGVS